MSQFLVVFGSLFFNVLKIIILVKVISSWFPNVPYNKLIEFIDQTSAPLLKLAKKIIPPVGIMDLSPILVFIALEILEYLWVAIFTF